VPYTKYLTIDMLVDIAQNDMLPPVSCTAITVAIIKRNTKRNTLFLIYNIIQLNAWAMPFDSS
jgi:hypothetical protein